MKNLLLLSSVLSIALLSSCKKDYNCVCRYDVLGVEQVDVYEIDDVKKETARDKCAEHEDETQILIPDAVCNIE